MSRTRSHIARAVLEGIAFQVNDVIAAMERDAGTKLRELCVDASASANNLLMHFQGDLLNSPRDPPLQHRDHRLGRGVPRRTGHGNLEEQK